MFKLTSKFVSAHHKEIAIITATILVFTTILVFSNQLISFWSFTSTKEAEAQVELAIKQELIDISKQREEIIFSGILNSALKNNNLSQLLILAQDEVKKRNLDFIVITDKDGFVLARSGLSVQQGDNIFQTTIQGRDVALGKTVTKIVREIQNPLTFLSGSYIFEQNQPIGSIFVGHILNTAFANHFQEEHLKQKNGEGEIIFYTRQEGVIGDSFDDKDKTQLVSAYFSLGSDLVAQNLTGLSKEIKIGDNYYTIYHIVFSGIGIEASPGGAFVLFPTHYNLSSLFLASSIAILLLVLLSFSLLFKFQFKFKILSQPKHIPTFLLTSLTLFVVMYFLTLNKLESSSIKLKKSPYIIYNSILKFEPESDVISQTSEKTIALKVYTGGEAINAVDAVIKYDPKAVEVLDIITTNSFCDPSFFLEKEINAEKGEVRFTCGLPNPGFSDVAGTVAELLVKPLGLKPISFEFSEETQVLANDGLGTNVLRAVTGGYYQVVRQKFATADIKNPIPVFSSSHPNSNRWYKNKNIKLSWPKLSGGTYYYTLSRNKALSAEDAILSTTNNFLDTFANNGIYYFHLQAKDAAGKPGLASSYKIMIDTTPPIPPTIKASNTIIKKGEIVRFEFASKDALSGLQSGFYVKINEGILLPVKPPFYIPFLESGEYHIVIRVFDKANNFSDSSMVIYVGGEDKQ